MSDLHYVYVHHRADDGLPFYVGKGKHKRAWSKDGRNRHWHRVCVKHGYYVQIIAQGMSDEDALDMEIMLIGKLRKLYSGSIVNVTDGGDGSVLKGQTDRRKLLIFCFLVRHGRLPKRGEDLYQALVQYVSEASNTYDPLFRGWALKAGYCDRALGQSAKAAELKKKELMSFYKRNDRFPCRGVPEEARMCSWMLHYCSPGDSSFDAGFRTWCEERGYGNRKRGPSSVTKPVDKP
jgi:hypothetical protein